MSLTDPTPFSSVRSRLAMPSVVTDRLHEFLAALVDDIDEPTLVIGAAPWWEDIVASMPSPAHRPDHALVVNRLRSVAPFSASMSSWLRDGLGVNGRLFFVEATRHRPGRFRSPRFEPFDVTGELWAAGLSIIDVHRPMIESRDGEWEFAIGRARVTPTRVM